MNENEARRIATIVTSIREDWQTAGLMKILADQRIIGRSFEGMVRVFVDLALDPTSKRPTRIFESGPWWVAAGPRAGSAYVPPPVRTDDCEICHQPPHPVRDDHVYEPRNQRGPGTKPPAAIKAALTTHPTTRDEENADG